MEGEREGGRERCCVYGCVFACAPCILVARLIQVLLFCVYLETVIKSKISTSRRTGAAVPPDL